MSSSMARRVPTLKGSTGRQQGLPDPDGAEWEWYTVLSNSDVMISEVEPVKSSTCC